MLFLTTADIEYSLIKKTIINVMSLLREAQGCCCFYKKLHIQAFSIAY